MSERTLKLKKSLEHKLQEILSLAIDVDNLTIRKVDFRYIGSLRHCEVSLLRSREEFLSTIYQGRIDFEDIHKSAEHYTDEAEESFYDTQLKRCDEIIARFRKCLLEDKPGIQ